MQLGGLEWGGVFLCLRTGSIQGERKQARTHTSTRSTVHTLTHSYTHTKIDVVPLTGDGKYDDSLRQGGDERSRYHRWRERERERGT